MYRTSWTREQRRKAKEKGSALYIFGIETLKGRAETGGHSLHPGTAWRLFQFIVFLGKGASPREAFEGAFEGYED